MGKVLNQTGKELILVKNNIIKDTIPEDILSIIVSKYPKDIQTLLLDETLDIINFTGRIKEYNKYCLSSAETNLIKNKNLLSAYNLELSNYNKNFTLKNLENYLSVEKYFRINKHYYNNFLGVNLMDLNKSKSTNYADCAKKLKKYQEFVFLRLSKVLKALEDNLYSKKIVKKTMKRFNTIYIATKVEENVATIALHIDINKEDDFNKNVGLINKYLSQVEDDIEKYMQYDLYNK